MNHLDLFNTTLLGSNEEVDLINKKFYGRFNYPWPPLMFNAYPKDSAAPFVSQDIGFWNHDRIPQKPKIWVAGCGTNQALFTALKFPEAEVFATDISIKSLNECRKNAKQIGVTNLYLEEKSLNDIPYEEQFDYIICTGVVHHNKNPESTLKRISRALKKNGIFEFMVYNYYHRLLTTACQKAIRTFYDSKAGPDMRLVLMLIKNLIDDFHYSNLMGNFLRSHSGIHEAEMADSLLQPVEYSYTIDSLGKLLDNCNLEYLLHCQNQFDVEKNSYTWNMDFNSDYLDEHYDSLSDIKRWQISNLLMANESPMLWFYLKRKDASFERKTEQQVCEEFLETKFCKNSFPMKSYILDNNGNYRLSDEPFIYPSENSIKDPIIKKVYGSFSPDLAMKDIFHQLKIQQNFYEVNRIRIKLTTSGYPYLLANPE